MRLTTKNSGPLSHYLYLLPYFYLFGLLLVNISKLYAYTSISWLTLYSVFDFCEK